FGLSEDDDLFARNIDYGESTTAEVVFEGASLGSFELPLVGEFNVRNMLGATGIALDEGIAVEDIKAALATFEPVKKRQELIGEVDDIRVIDDFAHHPTAVKATIDAMRARYPDRRIWAIFEAKSNTSRRRVFQHDYPPAFERADRVILSKPFEKSDDLSDEERVDIEAIADSIRRLGPTTELIPDVEEIVERVAAEAKPGDIVLGLSGSSFDGLHQRIVDALSKR
ncbi:MAG: glutamate ligase domain-containing protein, partial [Persicimonas sp.]